MSQQLAPRPSESAAPNRPPGFSWARASAGIALVVIVWAWVGALGGRIEPPDPIRILLLLIAITLTMRAAAHTLALGRLVPLTLAPRSFRLRFDGERVEMTGGGPPVRIRKERILGVAVDRRLNRPAFGTPTDAVLVVRQPEVAGGSPVCTLPAIFDRNPQSLAEALMRWKGPPRPSSTPSHSPKPPSLRYECAAQAAARGDTRAEEDGTIAVRHGWMWLSYGPFEPSPSPLL